MKLSYEKIYQIFFLFLSAWIGIGLLKPYLAPRLGISTVLFVSGITLVIFLCFFLTKGKQRIIPAIITGVILLGIFLTRYWVTVIYLNTYFVWIVTQNNFISSFQYLNIFLATAILIPFALLMARVPKLRLIVALFLFACLLYGLFSGYIIDKIAVCFCLLFISFVLTELLQDVSFRQKIAVCLIPFLGIYMLIILILPTKNEPYEWKAVKVIINQVYDIVINISNNIISSFSGGNEGFGMEVTGFTGEARIGGNISSRTRTELFINQKSGKQMTIYLRGNVFDSFDGNSWNANAEPTENEFLLDLIEMIYAIERFDPGFRTNYLAHSDLNISYTGLSSNYVFVPLRMLKIDSKTGLNMTEYESELRFDSVKSRGTEYNLTYFQANSGQDFFREMIISENMYEYDVQPPVNMMLDYFLLLGEPFQSLDRILKERSEKIHHRYTEKYPISEDVRNFLTEIIKDAENNYEKCKAIERALAGQAGIDFQYTKTPGGLPEGKDFLDYFLLESHSGYCTYFATAFTLLVRELGLPSRYVQGFMVYDEDLGRKPVAVTNTMAHAWPEVYFDGVGWISFEPTPGFGHSRYQYWLPTFTSNVALERPASPMPEIPETPEPEESFIKQLLPQNEGNFSLFSLVLIIISSLIIAVTVFIFIDYLVKKRRFSRYGPAEQFIEHVRANLQILNLLGLRFLPGETICEFKERVNSEEPMPLNFLDLCEYFLYRENTAVPEMIATVLSDRKTIFEIIKHKWGLRYYLLRFRLLLHSDKLK
ncbi:MAG: DUF3488 and transglutaminase-like domain-containing protein [Lachnospiraceae bacterium]|nr:DUF3488 and transglutaminase-like domain-containing protein [Lachnospiraceae bacterium]